MRTFLSLVLIAWVFSCPARAATPVPFTIDEVLDIMGVKRWKYERLYREPPKGVQVAIVTGYAGPNGELVERQFPNPFVYEAPSRQTRYVVGLVLVESSRTVRTMIDGVVMEASMPADFKHDYEMGTPAGIEDGELIILSFTPKKQGEAMRSRQQMKAYFGIRVTPTR